MLVLCRKVGERIVIGPPDNPYGYISVESVSDGKTRIGLKFGPEIEIHREEVADRIVAEKTAVEGTKTKEDEKPG